MGCNNAKSAEVRRGLPYFRILVELPREEDPKTLEFKYDS